MSLSFLPELVMLLGALLLFVLTLGPAGSNRPRWAALGVSIVALIAAIASLKENSLLFAGAYQVDLFSQGLKVVFAAGFVLLVLLSGKLGDIREDLRAEYFLLLALSVSGLMMLVSSIDLITLVIALEVSAFPLYLMVPMRREKEGQRTQMESAVKYMMFGVAANGVMFFGMSYVFGLTGTTSLPQLLPKLQPLMDSPIALIALAMTLCGFYYKLAVFPFHFWTPDVYQGASNETAALVASLPKVGGVAVIVRLVSLAGPVNHSMAMLLAVLAGCSMCYGNLIALFQKDFKRLLGFSGIAHAGYALLGIVALDQAGFGAALYYAVGYLLMVLACFVVICRVSKDGTNVSMQELAGLHRRSPLLAITLAVGVFGLAGMPPFVGFMAKLSVLSAALSKGYLALVLLAVINAAIAIYYYLGVIRESWFRDPTEAAPILIDWRTRALCVGLIAGILALGIVPSRVMDTLSASVSTLRAAPVTALVAAPVH